MKLIERKKVINLRKQGMTISEIRKFVDVSKSTISLWISEVKLSNEALKIVSKKIKLAQIKSRETILKKTRINEYNTDLFAKKVVDSIIINKSTVQLLCSLLYECEGGKVKNGTFSFTNSDPNLIKVFLGLLRNSFSLDEAKFRVCIHLHNYHNPNIQLDFWSRVTSIPKGNFMKPYIKLSSGDYEKANYQGCINIRYYDVSIKRKLQAIFSQFTESHLYL